jgi:hypothetical protein
MPRLATKSIGFCKAALLALNASRFSSRAQGHTYDCLQRLNVFRSDGRRTCRVTLVLPPDDRSGTCLLSCGIAPDGHAKGGVNHLEVLSRSTPVSRRAPSPQVVPTPARPGSDPAMLDLAAVASTGPMKASMSPRLFGRSVQTDLEAGG